MAEEKFEKQKTLPDIHDEELSTSDGTPPIPDYIGPYKIESLLDRGGMSFLYLGLHPETKIPVTVKVLSPKFLKNEEIVKRFLQESEIIAMADHPNIVKLYGQGEWEKGLYICMEFIQGISLRQFLQQSAMSLRRSLDIILEVSYALCHLHVHGVVHRDLKPENILLTETGKIKVIDFGIAQLQEELTKDKAKQFIGTPVYMSPEQKTNPNDVSFASDIYSLGIITYELLIGQLSNGVIHLQLVPKGLQKIIKKCLHLEKKKRFQDIVDFITAINAYINSDAISKDQRGGDFVSELSENLQQAQETLLPQKLPQWKDVEMGIFNHKTQSITGIYFDFLQLDNGKYAIIMGESCSMGIETVLYSAVLRGMVRALEASCSDPLDLITQLNRLLMRDPMDQMFTLSFLTLDSNCNELSYISCGYGKLWHIPSDHSQTKSLSADNLALGIDDSNHFIEVKHPWNIGDTLLLNSFSTISNKKKGMTEKDFLETLTENASLPPQKQVHALYRKLRRTLDQPLSTRPITLISLRRHT